MLTLVQIAPYLLLTAGVFVCLAIFLSLKKEIYQLSKEMAEQQRELQNLEQRIAQQLDDVKSSLQESEQRCEMLVPPLPLRSGFNLSKRSQVMRMSRHGETPDNIATTLNLPRAEVDLLLKVQKIVLHNMSMGTTT